MAELLGITGAIGSGKTTFAELLGQVVENHATYETSMPIIEVANRFNQLLEAELNFDTTDNQTELVNQVLIWMPDVITEHLHLETTWAHLAITPKDRHVHPELYEKLFIYLKKVENDHRLVEQTITSANKSDYRPLLQWLGAYFIAKVSPTIWYDELMRRIDLHESHRSLVLIGGVRYLRDAAIIHERGGRVIAIVRSQHDSSKDDVTESEATKITPDITIINNGTLEQLRLCAETVWNDIAAGKPQKTYTTA